MASTEQATPTLDRRSTKNLPPIQTSFDTPTPPPPTPSRWRRARPAASAPATNAPPPAISPARPMMDRRQSRLSLFNLFSRPNVERARGHHETSPMPAVPESIPVSAPPTTSSKLKPLALGSSPSHVPAAPASRGRTAKGSVSKRPRDTTHWQPPPLFQAYPQAVKYATLQATSVSTETLLRAQTQRRKHGPTPSTVKSIPEGQPAKTSDESAPSNEKGRSSITGRMSTSSPAIAPDLSEKVFVMVTSGYILQYASEGDYDRMPEKVLKLGPDSAAFASDLIPGKHWVLRVCQAANADGTASNQPRSFFSRLGFQSSAAKRASDGFLLVMNGAEELDSWLTAVRKLIDQLNGKIPLDSEQVKSIAHTNKPLPETPSHRYQVKRDPARFDGARLSLASPVSPLPPVSPVRSIPDSPIIASPDRAGNGSQPSKTSLDSLSIPSQHNSSRRQSMEAPSLTPILDCADQSYPGHLREGSRLSVISSTTAASGTVTQPTSRGSSPASPSSPRSECVSHSDPDPPRQPSALRSFHMNPSSARRRSMQTLPPTDENQPAGVRTGTPQRHSTYGPVTRSRIDGPSPVANLADLPERQAITSTRPSPPPFRSSSTPLPPPPRTLPPDPPADARRRPQSTLGNLPSPSTITSYAVNRSSTMQRTSFRPVPIRPSEPSAPPRRYSLTPRPIPLPINPPSLTVRSASSPAVTQSTTSIPPTLAHTKINRHSKPMGLRRPSSMQIRTDHAPFLSSSRPIAAYNNPSPRLPSVPTPTQTTTRRLPTGPSIPVNVPRTPPPSTPTADSFAPGITTTTSNSNSNTLTSPQSIASPRRAGGGGGRGLQPRRSMPVMTAGVVPLSLPPPSAPPPTAPLPPPPPMAGVVEAAAAVVRVGSVPGLAI